MPEEIPTIDRRAFCVTNNVELGAIISCYFNAKSKYFSIFSFPLVDHQDGSEFTRLVTSRAQILITNRYVLVRPDFLILAGLNDFQLSFFSKINDDKKIIINDASEIGIKLSFLEKKFDGEIRCNKFGVIEALHIAKNENKLIVIDGFAPKIHIREGKSSNLVVIEKEMEIFTINAINYAFSIDAQVRLISKVHHDEVDDIYKQLNQWEQTRDQKAKDRVVEKLKKRIGKPFYDFYKSITFLTFGLPYSLVVRKNLPSCFIWSHAADFMIFDNIFVEENKFPIRDTCAIFSPVSFEEEETQNIGDIFQKNGYLVKMITGNAATIQNFDNYCGYYPYDIFHICSHGGETHGDYVRNEFHDRSGGKHIAEYFEIYSFSLTGERDKKGEPMVTVVTKVIFEKLDGLKWRSSKLKKRNYPKYVYDDMFAAIKRGRQDKSTVRVKTAFPIPTSTHVQCINGDHQGQFHSLASMGAPIIFNNSCSSGYYIAMGFLSAGARAYIGTLWKINNQNATNASEKFYQLCLENNFSLAMAVNQINQDLENTKDSSIYILWGLHFSRIYPPSKPTIEQIKSNLIHELENSLMDYLDKINDPSLEPEVKVNSIRIARFILAVLKNELSITPDMKKSEIKEVTSQKHNLEIKKLENKRFSDEDSMYL